MIFVLTVWRKCIIINEIVSISPLAYIASSYHSFVWKNLQTLFSHFHCLAPIKLLKVLKLNFICKIACLCIQLCSSMKWEASREAHYVTRKTVPQAFRQLEFSQKNILPSHFTSFWQCWSVLYKTSLQESIRILWASHQSCQMMYYNWDSKNGLRYVVECPPAKRSTVLYIQSLSKYWKYSWKKKNFY